MPGAVRRSGGLKRKRTVCSQGEDDRKTQTEAAPQPTDLFSENASRAVQHDSGRSRPQERPGGQPRTSYSLRHTYICLRLMEGADIYQIAKNCRTSVEMIEKYYASHIKNTAGCGGDQCHDGQTGRRTRNRRTGKNRQRQSQELKRLSNAAPADYRWTQCGRGGIGRRNGLKRIECPPGNRAMQNCSNSGKPVKWQSRAKPRRTGEGVETRRAAPKARTRYGEGIVQTTNAMRRAAAKAVAGMKIRWAKGLCRFKSGRPHHKPIRMIASNCGRTNDS